MTHKKVIVSFYLYLKKILLKNKKMGSIIKYHVNKLTYNFDF